MISIAIHRKLVSNNAEEVFRLLFKRLSFTKNEEITQKIQNHPHYPSFAAFDFALKKNGVDTLAIQANYEQLKNDLPSPFIVHLSANNGMFLLAEKADDNHVHFINEKHQIEKETKEDFLKQWSGSVMALDTDGISIQSSTSLPLSMAKYLFMIVSSILGVGLSIQQYVAHRDLYNYAGLLCAALGLGVCTLLMIRFFNKNNTFVKQLCTAKKEESKKSCDAILGSNAATIKGVSLTEVGFITFSFMFLTFLLFPTAISSSLIFTMSCVALPISLYSIYYQYAVAKQWCPLCLYVQAAVFLLFIAGVGLWDVSMITTFLTPAITKHVLLFALLVSGYLFLKPFIEKYYDQTNEKVRYEYNQLKFNPKVMQLLMGGEQVISKPNFETILIGNPEAKQVITVVFSPTCTPCIEEQKNLLAMIQTKQNTRIEQIILAHPEDTAGHAIAMNMLDAYETLDTEFFMKRFVSFFDHYTAEQIKGWSVAVSDPNKVERYTELLKKHSGWIDIQGVDSTPALFYNYKKLPREYSTEDLDYLCH